MLPPSALSYLFACDEGDIVRAAEIRGSLPPTLADCPACAHGFVEGSDDKWRTCPECAHGLVKDPE